MENNKNSDKYKNNNNNTSKQKTVYIHHYQLYNESHKNPLLLKTS